MLAHLYEKKHTHTVSTISEEANGIKRERERENTTNLFLTHFDSCELKNIEYEWMNEVYCA